MFQLILWMAMALVDGAALLVHVEGMKLLRQTLLTYYVVCTSHRPIAYITGIRAVLALQPCAAKGMFSVCIMNVWYTLSLVCC